MKYSRVHWYTILEYLPKFAFLLLIPIIQQLLFKPRSILEAISTMGISVLFIISILIWCFSEYYSVGYHAGKDYFHFKGGVLLRRTFSIPYDFIHSINIKEGVIPYFFGATKIRLDTPAGNSKNSDISMTLSRKALKKTVLSIFPKQSVESLYRSGEMRILLMTSSWANPGVGWLIAAPFVSRIGSILGEEITDRLYSTVNISVQLIALGIPPAAATLAYILVAGWAVAMFVQLFRYSNFSVTRAGEFIIIKRGLVSKSKRMIRISKINAVFVKQTLFMRMFKLYSSYVQAIGSKKEKGDKSLLIAAAKYHEMEKSLGGLLQLPIKSQNSIQPPKRALKSFLLLPGSFMLALLLLMGMLYVFGLYSRVYNMFFLFIAVFIIWWFFLRLISHKTSGLSFFDGFLVVSGYSKLSLVSSTISVEKIQKITIKQNPFQRRSGLCKVKVYILAERREFFSVNNLYFKDVENIVESVNNAHKI